MTKLDTSFDETTHTYRIGGFVVPSVTQIINEMLPGGPLGTEWQMNRGTEMHRAYAICAEGQDGRYEFDPLVAPYVAAWHEWQKANSVKCLSRETRVYHVGLMYAGTLDLVAEIGGEKVIVDYKSTIDPRVEWQLAGYSLAHGSIRQGLGVELRPGQPAVMRWYDLRRARAEWQAILTAYRVRVKLGITKERGQE